eukprot:8851811-Alexandrium_andersonii.AAC.1
MRLKKQLTNAGGALALRNGAMRSRSAVLSRWDVVMPRRCDAVALHDCEAVELRCHEPLLLRSEDRLALDQFFLPPQGF